MLLAGDIGGTKTVLALIAEEQGPHDPIVKNRFASSDYASLGAMVAEFLAVNNAHPKRACFGIAGPVHGNKVEVTNLPWQVDANILAGKIDGAPVHLLNDLEAIAYSIPDLSEDDVDVLRPGDFADTGPIAVIAPGTGLGEAYLFWDGSRYQPIPSEGGHTDFAPATSLELDLLAYLQPRLGHVSYERVCSGSGIPNLYSFFRDSGRHTEPDWLHEQLAMAEDPTPVIIQTALEESAAISVATLELFMAILGSEAGNLVLQVIATGGVYLGGGILPRIIPQLREGMFMEAFNRKGRFSELLSRVAVKVIVNSEAALLGAAAYGLQISSTSQVKGAIYGG